MKLPFKFSLKKKSGPTIGLDINSTHISAIQMELTKEGEVQVVKYQSLPTPANIIHEGLLADPVAAAEVVRELLALMDLSGKGPLPVANIAIPAQSVITRLMPVPVGMPTDELSDVVRQEAVNNLPFPIDDANIDWSLLSTTERLDPDGVKRVDVIFAAVQKGVVDSYWQMADFARIKLAALDVSSLTAIRALSFTEQLKQDESLTMVVNVRHDATDIALVRNSMPLFSRSVLIGLETIVDAVRKSLEAPTPDVEILALLKQVPVTGGQIADPKLGQVQTVARATLGDLTAEIGRSLDFYMSHVGAVQINQILLCGSGCIISDLNQFIANRLNLATTTAKSFESIAIDPELASNDNHIGENMILGLVIDPAWSSTPTVNLDLNKGGPSVMFTESAEAVVDDEDDAKEVIPTPWFVPALSGGVLIFLIIVGVWAYFDLYNKPKMEAEYKELETTIAIAKNKADTAAKQSDENKILEKKKQLLEGIVKHGTVLTNILTSIESNIPQDVQMTALNISGNAFMILGNTINFKNASHFALNLGSNSLFNNPSILFVKRLKKHPEQIGFQITGALNQPDIGAAAASLKATLDSKARPKLLDFYATWCPPCQKLSPILDGAERKYAGKIDFVRLNIDEPAAADLAKKYNIHSIPNLFFLDTKGNVVDHIEGGPSEDVLFSTLDKLSSLSPTVQPQAGK